MKKIVWYLTTVLALALAWSPLQARLQQLQIGARSSRSVMLPTVLKTPGCIDAIIKDLQNHQEKLRDWVVYIDLIKAAKGQAEKSKAQAAARTTRVVRYVQPVAQPAYQPAYQPVAQQAYYSYPQQPAYQPVVQQSAYQPVVQQPAYYPQYPVQAVPAAVPQPVMVY